MAEEHRPLSDHYDGYLQLFLRFAERGVPLSVTLHVGGSVISGQLISAVEYFDGVAKGVSQSFAEKGEESEEVKLLEEALSFRPFLEEKVAEQVAVITAQGTPLPPAATDEPPTTYDYIHLKHVRFYSPGGEPWTQPAGFLWRGKAAAVDGFMIGEFSVASS
jgi:hypothetical protein